MSLCTWCKVKEVNKKDAKFCSRICFHASTKGKMPKNLSTLHTPELNKQRSKAMLGDKHHHWGGDNVAYQAIHRWLRLYCLKSPVCKHCKKDTRTEWALIKGKEHAREKGNYMELCSSCHNKYDDLINRGWVTKKKNGKRK